MTFGGCHRALERADIGTDCRAGGGTAGTEQRAHGAANHGGARRATHGAHRRIFSSRRLAFIAADRIQIVLAGGVDEKRGDARALEAGGYQRFQRLLRRVLLLEASRDDGRHEGSAAAPGVKVSPECHPAHAASVSATPTTLSCFDGYAVSQCGAHSIRVTRC